MATVITSGTDSQICMNEMPVRNRQSPDNNNNETTSRETISAGISITPSQASNGQFIDCQIIASPDNTSEHSSGKLPERMRVTNIDIALFVGGIVLYLLDVLTDIFLSVKHCRNHDYWYFGLTLTFILLPSLVIMRRWYNYLCENQTHGENQPHELPPLPIQPTTACARYTLTACICLQLGPIYQRIDILEQAFKSRQTTSTLADRVKQFKCYSYKKLELSRLLIIEAFMESAPQLVLQLYIVANAGNQSIDVWTGAGVLVSLVSITYAMVTYESMRLWFLNGSTWSIPEYIGNYLWRIFVIVARVLTLSLFASVFPSYLAVVVCLHYVAMFVWIVYAISDIVHKNSTSRAPPPTLTPDWPPINWRKIPEPIGENQSVPAPRGDQEGPDDYRNRIMQTSSTRFYKELQNSAGLAFVFIFCYHNPDGKLIRQRFIYYTILFIENCVLMAVWYAYCPDDRWYKSMALYAHFGCFFLGVTILSVYNLWIRSHSNNTTESNTVANDNPIVSPQLPNSV